MVRYLINLLWPQSVWLQSGGDDDDASPPGAVSRDQWIDVGPRDVISSSEVLVVILGDELSCKSYRLLAILPSLPALTAHSSLGCMAVLTSPTLLM